MEFAALLVFAAAAAMLSFPPLGRGPSRSGIRLGDLLDSIPLANRQSRFAGIWEHGELDGTRVAFQTDAKTLVIYAGRVERDVDTQDVYLGRSPREAAERELGSVVVDLGSEDSTGPYFPWSETASNDPVLQIPGVRDALRSLSPAAVNVGIHKPRGVQIELDLASVTPGSLADDTRRAVELLRALGESRLLASSS